MVAVFRAPSKFTRIYIPMPVYSDDGGNEGIELAINREPKHIVGTCMLEYLFCEGEGRNELVIEDDIATIYRLREYALSHPAIKEVFSEGVDPVVEAPINADAHTQHIADLEKRYGNEKERYESNWDRKYSDMLRKR